MPNEEPVFIPPKPGGDKSAKLQEPQLIKKWMVYTVMGISVYYLLVYVFISIYYYSGMGKLNELYAISSNLSLAGLMFVFLRLFEKGKINLHIRAVILTSVIFFASLSMIYLVQWVIYGKSYTLSKQALILSLVATFIYIVYDIVRTHSNRAK